MANDIVLYDVPDLGDADLAIDFIDTDNLEEIEEGIRRIEATSDILGLVQGIAVVKVERDELWRQGGFETLRSYRIAQLDRLAIPRQTLSSRRKVAEGFLDNRKLFGKMSLTGHVSKLALVSEAIRVHGDRREVLAHFKADTFREFQAWVHPRALPAPDLPDVDLHIDNDEISLDGVPMLAFDEDLPAEERDFIAKGLRDLYQARKGALLPHVVGCYDAGEARWLEKALREHRAQK